MSIGGFPARAGASGVAVMAPVLFEPHEADGMALSIDFLLLIVSDAVSVFLPAAAQAGSADANTNAVGASAIAHLRLKRRLSSRATSAWKNPGGVCLQLFAGDALLYVAARLVEVVPVDHLVCTQEAYSALDTM